MTRKQTDQLRLGRLAACIAVTDIDRSIAFFQDLFDMAKTFENGTPVGFVILRRDDAELHLTLDRDHRSTVNNVAHLIVSDAATLYARCQQMGVRIVKGLRDEQYGLRDFVIADPDGNRIDIGQPI